MVQPILSEPKGPEQRGDVDRVKWGRALQVVKEELLEKIARELALEGVAGVFYDLTNKPPATIEWE